jgi:hypothetical protein
MIAANDAFYEMLQIGKAGTTGSSILVEYLTLTAGLIEMKKGSTKNQTLKSEFRQLADSVVFFWFCSRHHTIIL